MKKNGTKEEKGSVTHHAWMTLEIPTRGAISIVKVILQSDCETAQWFAICGRVTEHTLTTVYSNESCSMNRSWASGSRTYAEAPLTKNLVRAPYPVNPGLVGGSICVAATLLRGRRSPGRAQAIGSKYNTEL